MTYEYETTSQRTLMTINGIDLFNLVDVTSLVVTGNNKNTFNTWVSYEVITECSSWNLSLGCARIPTYPTFQVTSYQDARVQLSLYGCCRLVLAETPTGDFLLPPLLADGTHLVISHETSLVVPPIKLTVVATHDAFISPSTFALQMINEVVTFVKTNGVWSSYSGF
jgi:hypothetical protein